MDDIAIDMFISDSDENEDDDDENEINNDDENESDEYADLPIHCNDEVRLHTFNRTFLFKYSNSRYSSQILRDGMNAELGIAIGVL